MIGLSATMTLRAPAPKQSRVTAATVSGWVVAARSGFLSKATFGLMTTTSPFWMKWATPPMVSIAALTIEKACSSRALSSSSLVAWSSARTGRERTTTRLGRPTGSATP